MSSHRVDTVYDSIEQCSLIKAARHWQKSGICGVGEVARGAKLIASSCWDPLAADRQQLHPTSHSSPISILAPLLFCTGTTMLSRTIRRNISSPLRRNVFTPAPRPAFRFVTTDAASSHTDPENVPQVRRACLLPIEQDMDCNGRLTAYRKMTSPLGSASPTRPSKHTSLTRRLIRSM